MSVPPKYRGDDTDDKKIELDNIARPDVANGSVLDGEPGGFKAGDNNEQVVSQAIEAIGMGRYQWSLAASCGFGFLVDQVRIGHIPQQR